MEKEKLKIFNFFVAGFFAGVFFRSYIDWGVFFSFFAFFAGLALLILCLLKRRAMERAVLTIAVLVISFSFGSFRSDISQIGEVDNLEKYTGQSVSFQGMVDDEPDRKDASQSLVIKLEKTIAGGREVVFSTKVLVFARPYPEFAYGDRVKVSGKVEKPKKIEDERGKIFDYASYLQKDGIKYTSVFPEISLLSKGNGNIIKEKMFGLKNLFSQKISQALPEPQSSLLGGIILGSKQSLGKKLIDDFRKAGVIHIVVLSGYNITIVAEAIKRMFSFLPRLFGIYFGAAGIILFAIMTGAGATVVRASIMALIVLLAKVSARTYEIKRTLFVAGFLMVFQNPKILVFDSSFQLSFLAAVGLIYISPIIMPKFHFVTEKFGIREIVVSTIATQIFVLPLLIYKMGEMSLVSLPANFLILSFIPATMFFGFVTALSAFAGHFISLPFAFVSYVFLTYELEVVEFFSSLSFATVSINYFPAFFLFLIYAVYLLVILNFKKPYVPKNMAINDFKKLQATANQFTIIYEPSEK